MRIIVQRPITASSAKAPGPPKSARTRRWPRLGSTLLAIGLLGWANESRALAPVPVPLSGNTSYDEWSNSSLTAAANPGFPGFPGVGPWPNPIASNLGGDATLNKMANGAGGGPFPATGSIYHGGIAEIPNTFGGTLAVVDSTPLSDLKTIVFQIEIGEAFGYDFYNNVVPALSYNGGSQAIVPTFQTLVFSEQTGTFEDEPVYQNLYAFQWNTSGIVDPITSYTLSWSSVQHSQVYALRLDTSSDVYTSAVVTPVPEPHFYALAISGLLVIFVFCRRRKPRPEDTHTRSTASHIG